MAVERVALAIEIDSVIDVSVVMGVVLAVELAVEEDVTETGITMTSAKRKGNSKRKRKREAVSPCLERLHCFSWAL